MNFIKTSLRAVLYASLFILFSSSAYSAQKNTSCTIPDFMEQIGKDFKKFPELKSAITGKTGLTTNDLDAALFTAWKQLYDNNATQAKRSAVELLEGIKKYFKERPFKDDPDLRQDYINAIIKYAGAISTNSGNQGSERFPDEANVFFDQLARYAQNFYGKKGFSIKETGGYFYTQDGFYFSMRYMNARINPNQVTAIDISFDAIDNGCSITSNGRCRLDLETETIGANGLPQKNRYEFKSYGKNTELTQVGQLIGYVRGADNLQSFKYVFDGSKLNESQAKAKMKTFLMRNKAAVFEAIKGNASLRAKVFPEIPVLDLSVNDLTDAVITNMVNQIVEVF